MYRRTQAERESEQISWERSDQAFFAAGACHVLAWTCRDVHSDQPIGIGALRFVSDKRAFHAVATWQDWTFDHSGWHKRARLLDVNEAFEDRQIEWLDIDADLESFCAAHRCRLPADYWQDPLPRARTYVALHAPPWLASTPGAV